jgi:hypothetical protein
LAHKKQGNQESVRSFGNALITLAKKAFPNAELATIDEFLKQTFQRGIREPALRLIALEKLNKMNSKQDKMFNLEKFIEYVDGKEQARAEIAKATGDIYSQHPFESSPSSSEQYTRNRRYSDNTYNNNRNYGQQQRRIYNQQGYAMSNNQQPSYTQNYNNQQQPVYMQGNQQPALTQNYNQSQQPRYTQNNNNQQQSSYMPNYNNNRNQMAQTNPVTQAQPNNNLGTQQQANLTGANNQQVPQRRSLKIQ